MVYRCDLQHFIVHAIDYFTLPDLTNMQYAIISAKISSGGRARNVVKVNDLYPDVDTIMAYEDYKDKSILKKMYLSMINPKDKKFDGIKKASNPYSNTIYKVFINPLMEHYNIMIICDQVENDYIDILCEYLKDEFDIEVIDLNQLFTKGRIGAIYIDREKIRNKAVDIRRAALKEQVISMASTREGKEKLISKMSKKEKMRNLKKYGITITARDKDKIDQILLDEWCAEEGQDDDWES